MSCKEIEYLMPLYLSGELDSATMARLECHAAECPVCHREMREQQALDRALSQALLTESIDATPVQARVMSRIRGEQRRPHLWQTLRITLAAAVLLLCAVMMGSLYLGSRRYRQVEMDHVNEVVMGHEQRWRYDEPGIEKLAADRLSMQLQPQELSIPGYRLLRGRRCLVGSHHYLHLVYGNGAEEMSLYILPRGDRDLLSRVSALLPPHISSRAESGYNVTEGDAKGWRILLVGTTEASKQQAIISDRLSTLG